MTSTYALCERVTATPTSPNHIRALTDAGLKLSGGADTAALCGAVVAWDLYVIDLADLPGMLANQHATFRICAGCAAAALNENSSE